MQVPIQVNKYLAYSDGMRVIESGKLSVQSIASDVLPDTELDQLVLESLWRLHLLSLLIELDSLKIA